MQGDDMTCFHSGIVNYGRHIIRPEAEARLFNSAIVPWREVVDVFAKNATVTRCGTFPSSGGWMWNNFWWAFSSAMNDCNAAIQTIIKIYGIIWIHSHC